MPGNDSLRGGLPGGKTGEPEKDPLNLIRQAGRRTCGGKRETHFVIHKESLPVSGAILFYARKEDVFSVIPAQAGIQSKLLDSGSSPE
jgi:hypothetical protein